MKRSPAVITVFFSLLSIIFLGLAFTMVEAVRYRGARAHCADLTGVSNWSVFAEYENRLLEDFDLFGIDGSSGGGSLSVSGLETRLKAYLDENTDVTGNISGKLPGLTFDPFRVSAEKAEITEYALLSDQNGEYFYQQAVNFMHKTAWMNALGKLSESARTAQKAKKAQEDYEKAKENADRQLDQLKKGVAQKTAQAESSGQPSSDIVIIGDSAPDSSSQMYQDKKEAEKVKNPLWKMITLYFKKILPEVCGKGNWSKKKIPGSSLLSKRSRQKGNLKLDTGRGGVTDDLLFREYLLDHFPCRISGPSAAFRKNHPSAKTTQKTDYPLDYQLEYILSGTASDEKNLKKTVKKILLLRESYNYLYLQSDTASLGQTESLAALILGWTGNAGLIETFRELLVVYWAYGESLYDVRILMHGGKVPLVKTQGDWHISLEQLYDLEELLKGADTVPGRGESYSDYLRLLLNLQPVGTQKKRSLDLLEMDLRKSPDMENFRADSCVIGIKDTCSFQISPVFSRVTEVFLHTGLKAGNIKVDGGFAYE